MRQMIWPFLLGLPAIASCGGKSTPPPESAAPSDVAADDASADDLGEPAPPDGEEAGGESAVPDGESGAAGEGEAADPSDAEPGDAPAEESSDALPPSANLEDYMGAAPPTPEYKTVQENMKVFKFCYLDAMRANPDLQGTIRVRFTVNKAGKVPKAKAIENELDKAVETCVIKALKKLKFPKRDSNRTVEYPFKFIPAPKP